MQGLAIRMARGLNRLMQRQGAVFADRYHAHILRSLSEVRRAVHYVLGNIHKHSRQYGRPISEDVVDPYSSARYRLETTGPPISRPRTWLLRLAM